MANTPKLTVTISPTWRTHIVYWPGLWAFKLLAWPAAKVAPGPTRWALGLWMRAVTSTFRVKPSAEVV